jgi:histidinol-phosphate aminotransferase
MTRDQSLTELAAAAVCELAPYQPGKPLAELEREYGVRDAIKLASNENPLELPASVRAAIRDAIGDVSRYPDGACFSLRAALASHLGVSPDAITLGNGSNDVLVLLAETFLTPAVNAVYDQYSFVVYRLAVQATGAEARVATSLPRDHEQPLGHDLEAMRALIDARTRMVFIANPNNPTGTWLNGDALHAFLADLPAHVIAVVDEAYYEYARDDQWPDVLSWLDDFPNLVVTRTFSKAYGLAGLRLGYGVSSPAVAELLNRVRQPFNVNTLAQAAALAALQETSWLQECHAENARELRHVTASLAGMGLRCLPSKGNFVLAEIPDAAACNDFLLQRGIIVRPVANYGLHDYLRISIGNRSENHRLLAGVSAYMSSRR